MPRQKIASVIEDVTNPGSLTFNIPLFMKDKLKIGLSCVTIKLLFHKL